MSIIEYDNIDYSTIKILVIDDEPFIRKLIVRILFDIGIKNTSEADNGLKAINKIIQSRTNFDLIICDLEMPIISGLEFLKTLRKHPEVRAPETPVVILTGHSDEDNIYDAVMLGIHGFLTKPVSRNDLEAKIKMGLTGKPIDPARLRRS